MCVDWSSIADKFVEGGEADRGFCKEGLVEV